MDLDTGAEANQPVQSTSQRLLRSERSKTRSTERRDVYTTAVASISTLASASTSAVTSTTAMAGKWRPITSRYAAPISFRPARYSSRSVTIPGQPHDVLGAGVGLGEHGDDVAQRLADLAGHVGGRERAGLVPADLAADEHEPARRLDPVRVAARLRPARRLQAPHGARPRSTLRCTLPVGVRGSASRNLIRRGYLYGAIRSLTWSCSSRAATGSDATT